MEGELLPFEKYLEELTDTDKPLATSKLANLSGLSPEEIELFKEAWAIIDLERHRQIASRLAELTEDNFELDFDEAFRVLLEDGDGQVRLKAIEGLGECEDRSLIDPLIALLHKDSDLLVQAAAAAALGKFTILAELGKLRPCHAVKVKEALLATIRDKEEQLEVQRRAIEAIAPLSQSQVKELIHQAYNSDNHKLQSSALCAMGRNCDPIWLPILLKELGSPDPEMRYEAAVACGELGAQEAVPHLLELIQDPDVQVQLSAIAALGHIGGCEAKQELHNCLDDTDERIQEAAEVALEELGLSEDPLFFELED